MVAAEEHGVRVFWVAAASMQALVLGERMADGDELHVTYNAMQSGFRQYPPQRKSGQWTELDW